MTSKNVFVALGLVSALFNPACAVDAANPQEDVGTASAAISLDTLPHGMVAGLDHTFSQGGVGIAQGENNRIVSTKYAYTTDRDPALGFDFLHIGDRGMPEGQGFTYQTLASGTWDTEQIIAPRGTVCGLKHQLNARYVRCLGADPGQGVCPDGFLPKRKGDWIAPSGGDFAWCEWQDPQGKCEGMSCFDKIPVGTVCGLRSNAEDGEVPAPCGTVDETSGTECPNGFAFVGYYDAGRSAGRGLGWCQKSRIN